MWEGEPTLSRHYLDDEKKARKAFERRQLLAKRARDEFIDAAMQQPQGREFFWWLLDRAGTHADPFATNALIMARSAGAQALGQEIEQAIIEVSPHLYTVMLEEQYAARRANERDTATDTDNGG